MRRYLIVANRTLTGPHLITEACARQERGPCRFHVVVPLSLADEGLVWSEGQAHAHARARLEDGLERLHQAGLDVTGTVGDESPLRAVSDALREQDFDEIIVSTLPASVSRWVKLDLPNRLRRRFAVPVTHVIASQELAH